MFLAGFAGFCYYLGNSYKGPGSKYNFNSKEAQIIRQSNPEIFDKHLKPLMEAQEQKS